MLEILGVSYLADVPSVAAAAASGASIARERRKVTIFFIGVVFL